MTIIKFLQCFSNPYLDFLFTLITMMGEHIFLIVVITTFYWCINKNLGYKLGFTILSGSMINGLLKNVFHTKRPIGIEGIRSLRTSTAGGYSFPSGHTQNTSSLWTSIFKESKKTWVFYLSIILIILVAISRLYLGVHWPIDVIFGAIIGILWALLCYYIFDFSNKSGNKFTILILLIPGLFSLITYGEKNTLESLAILIGFMIGYFIEDKYINFTVKATLVRQIIKYSIGMSIALIIEEMLKIIFPEYLIFCFIRYLLIGLWITAGATYIFKKLNL